MRKIIAWGLLLTLINTITYGAEKPLPVFKFEHISTQDGLPTNEINQVYQDKDGYIWFATNSGLCQYDGYSIRTYKSNLYTPDILNNNIIYCLQEDNNHCLWIGTYNGLNVLDKTTGEIKKIVSDGFSDRIITKLLITSNNEIWVGTESGVFEYDPEKNEYVKLFVGELPNGSVKALIEDSGKNIWIGTWSDGLHRYNPDENKLYHYPPLDADNAAHAIFEDSQQRLWVGTWKTGLYLLENPYDTDNLTIRSFSYSKDDPHSIGDNYIFDISEDLNTGTIWVGTRNGLSILYKEEKSLFLNYLPEHHPNTVSYNVITSVIRDRDGLMWLGTTGGGVNAVITHTPEFGLNRLEFASHEFIRNPSVRSILVDKNGLIWIGLGNLGFLIHNRITGKYVYNMDSPDFAFIGRIPTVNTIYQSPTTGKIWIGTYDWGIVSYDATAEAGKKARLIDRESDPWISNQCVFSIMEDHLGNTWFGTRNGICYLTPDGDGIRFNSMELNGNTIDSYSFVAMVEDNDHTLWTGTSNGGIIQLSGNWTNPDSVLFKKYAPENEKLNSVSVLCLFIDKQKRLWAGTEGGGLNLYDPEKDVFVSVHKQMNLPGDAIFSIQQDTKGNLWLGTNSGLLRLHIPGNNMQEATYRLYTTSDGLQDNMFYQNSAFTDINGEMYFGGHHGYNYFFPDRMSDDESYPPVFITDVKIFNRSWSLLNDREQAEITSAAPSFTEKIKLNYKRNNFNIEFAALGYTNPSQIKYAYKLDGYDKEWQYTDATRRFAYYNNLSPGNYIFQLRSTNSNGSWNKENKTLQVVILPPPWKTWWAYLIYIILIIFVLYAIYRFMQYRLELKNKLQLAALEQAKAEEINHSKLQFFTNITHELLTPLTIISASVDELRLSMPQNKDHFNVMTNNINRLIRLLQQILEFRKAETGNLKLKVSQGDLVSFVQRSVDSFGPLIKKRQVHISFTCKQESIPAYFDPDKLDKILYNLLSNAAKYNDPGNIIKVELEKNANDNIVLHVADNGKGISPEASKNLFKRFYEGDYRKFNTIGTGIGLSLTKDLIQLHKGNITVISELGKGTKFNVVLPINHEAYTDEEIDNTFTVPISETTYDKEVEDMPVDEKQKTHSLLIIEDNEDLLRLMVRLLTIDYNVLTAKNGREGIEILGQQDIDLIVSDIMMPEMNGVDFCRYVKSNLEISHIPVILLTAKSREEDRVEAYESGADGFISKPFNLSVLHARITNLLKAKERTTRDFKKQLVFEANELNYTSIDEEFLQKAIDLIHNNLNDSGFDQQTFLEAMGTSKSTLYRKIKSLTGLNTSAFIRNIRLKAACRIIEEKKHVRISELAYAVGFNDPKYFSVCFKKEFGMHPSEYIDRFVSE